MLNFTGETFSNNPFDRYTGTIHHADYTTYVPYMADREDLCFLRVVIKPDEDEVIANHLEKTDGFDIRYYLCAGTNFCIPATANDENAIINLNGPPEERCGSYAAPGPQSTPNQEGFAKGSSVETFQRYLVKSGFDLSRMPADGNITKFLVGARIVWESVEREAKPKKKSSEVNLVNSGAEKTETKVYKDLMPSKVIEYIDIDSKGFKSGGGVDPAVESEVEAFIAGKLPCSKVSLLGEAVKNLNPEIRAAAMPLINNDTWLSDGARPWTFDSGNLSAR